LVARASCPPHTGKMPVFPVKKERSQGRGVYLYDAKSPAWEP
jgi:hypothetical protein